jgi:hypothetical protein
MKREQMGMTRGTSVDFHEDGAMQVQNNRKGVSISIRLEPQDVVKLHAFLSLKLNGEAVSAGPPNPNPPPPIPPLGE